VGPAGEIFLDFYTCFAILFMTGVERHISDVSFLGLTGPKDFKQQIKILLSIGL
jgi:hypothetical protein